MRLKVWKFGAEAEAVSIAQFITDKKICPQPQPIIDRINAEFNQLPLTTMPPWPEDPEYCRVSGPRLA